MTSFAQTKSIELPVLGRSPEDWRDGLAHAAEWAMAIDHARKAYPALDQNMTLYLTQCCSPGALKVLNSLIRGKGSEELDEAYPDDMNLTTSNAANVTAPRKFHDGETDLSPRLPRAHRKRGHPSRPRFRPCP